MTSSERLFADMMERAIVTIESWLAPSMGEDAITVQESIQLWLRSTTAGPRVRCAVYRHYEGLGYSL